MPNYERNLLFTPDINLFAYFAKVIVGLILSTELMSSNLIPALMK